MKEREGVAKARQEIKVKRWGLEITQITSEEDNNLAL